jgi:hypothetical protein
MESKNMKIIRLYIFIALCTLFQNAFAQDEFRFHYSIGSGLTTIKLTSTEDVGDGTTTIIDNNIVPLAPNFKNITAKGKLASPSITAGFSLPIIKNNNWSVGVNINAGLGSWVPISNSDGLLSPINVDLPEYIYYRNYKNKIDYSLMLGYRYTYTVLPTQHILGAVEVCLFDDNYLRLYTTLNRYNYYVYYSNGESKPVLGFSEIGLTLTMPVN